MLQKLITQAESKAGTQKALANQMGVLYHRFGDYKAGRRIPDDTLVVQLAEYVGENPVKVLFEVKAETDPKNAHLWQKMACLAGIEPATFSFGG